jgi:methionyl-tRNA formyltransferase
MRILLIGAVEEGHHIFNAILQQPEHRKDVCAIITLNQKPGAIVSGACSFDDLAQKHEVPLHKVNHVRDEESAALIKKLQPDLILVFGFSQLISDEVLRIPRLGTVGLHTTLLPRHRGRAPIPWSIIKDLGKSGNTLFFFTPGADNGDIIAQQHFYLRYDDDAETIYGKGVETGIDLILQYLPLLKEGKAPRIKQDDSLADHWDRRRPDDGKINWNQSSLEIYNLIRAVAMPYPGAFTSLNDKKLYVWKASLLGLNEIDLPGHTGEIVDFTKYDDAFIVKTGDHYLMLNSLQFENEPVKSCEELFSAKKIKIGDQLL